MNGIFNYQVPGQKAQVNQAQPKLSSPDEQFKEPSDRKVSFTPDIIAQILSLLAQLLENIGSPQNDGPPDATTLAVGEEDGGTLPPHDRGDPPDATTLAVGEEDGGTLPPPDATTLAVGEEDGGISPPIYEKPPTFTTLALGEEDGGISPPIDKPPIATTLALGEEDGGDLLVDNPPEITTKALGEEDNGNTLPNIKY